MSVFIISSSSSTFIKSAGLTNTLTAVKNAQMAESPLLLIGGAAATLLKGRGALQDIDQIVLFRPLCKFCASIRRLRDIKPTITRALHIAQSGTPGTCRATPCCVINIFLSDILCVVPSLTSLWFCAQTKCINVMYNVPPQS